MSEDGDPKTVALGDLADSPECFRNRGGRDADVLEESIRGGARQRRAQCAPCAPETLDRVLVARELELERTRTAKRPLDERGLRCDRSRIGSVDLDEQQG